MGIQLKDNKISQIYSFSKRAFVHYKLQIVLLMVLGFVGGILEGVGINAVIPLFSFIVGSDHGNEFMSQAIR